MTQALEGFGVVVAVTGAYGFQDAFNNCTEDRGVAGTFDLAIGLQEQEICRYVTRDAVSRRRRAPPQL
jgi:hypothetical protein